jgi:hypothetical protein
MKSSNRIFFSLFVMILFSGVQSFGQITYDFGFQRDFSVQVFNEQNQLLKNPWVGGFNAVHFNEIDLNTDGIQDLVVFDTQRDRLMTFLNQGISGTVGYIYAPQYEKYFPKITGWIRLRDFNNDGKPDIFTYGYAGIKVYKNTSTISGGLSFSLYTQTLYSNQGGVLPTNIQVTEVDYPAIEDIDGDGDLDLLVFAGLGSTIEYHKNYSKDSTGTLDTLWMALNHRCWGWFSEDPNNNAVILHINQDTNTVKYCNWGIPGGRPEKQQSGGKHAGSTLLLVDLNGDGVKDLLLGDTDYPTVMQLINGGTPDSAHIISFHQPFPQSDTVVHLYNLVNTDFLDVNNDGKKDLIAGALSPGWFYPKVDNINNAWWYKNIGTNSYPDFKFQTKSFLADGMIDVGANSHPVLFDYNGDSLPDLIIGGYGLIDSAWMDPWLTLHCNHRSRLTLYKNTGTSQQPAFTYITNDFGGVASLGLVGAYPTFGDLNGDGKPDMLLGDSTGVLHYFENNAPVGQPMNLVHVSSHYHNIDVGQFSTPQIFDLDKDGLLDIIIGYKERSYTNDSINYYWSTSLSYYKNTGTATSPQFTLQTDSLGGVRVNDSYYHYYDGYSAPCFYRDSAGVTSLFVGSGPGLVFYYRNIDGNLAGTFGKDSNMVMVTDYDHFYSVQHFENEDHNAQTIDMKLKSAPALGDLNGDGYPEMILGNWAGGLRYFKGTKPLGVGIRQNTKAYEGEVRLFPNPASSYCNILITGGNQDMQVMTSVYSLSGQLMFRQYNTGDDLFILDTSILPNGVYIARIEITSILNGTTGVFNRRIIVRK